METKLTIITINLNNVRGLQKTTESVFAQTFTDYEYIIIDGGSNDGSREFIEKNGDKFSYWVSEKDIGIYNAMNKGITKAKGEYFFFLNSGDYFCNNLVLDKVFSTGYKYDIFYGNIIWSDKGSYIDGLFPDLLTFEYFTNNSLPHQGSFIHSRLFETIGLYDEKYTIISDWIFFLLAIYKFNYSYRHIDLMITVCNREGLSCDPANWQQIVNDKREVIQHHFSAFALDYEVLISIRKELNKVKTMLGYRLHRGLRKLLKK